MTEQQQPAQPAPFASGDRRGWCACGDVDLAGAELGLVHDSAPTPEGWYRSHASTACLTSRHPGGRWAISSTGVVGMVVSRERVAEAVAARWSA